MHRHGYVSMPLLGAHSREGHAHTFMAMFKPIAMQHNEGMLIQLHAEQEKNMMTRVHE